MAEAKKKTLNQRAAAAGAIARDGARRGVVAGRDGVQRAVFANSPILGAMLAAAGSQPLREASRSFVTALTGGPVGAQAAAAAKAPAVVQRAQPGDTFSVSEPAIAPRMITPQNRLSAAVDSVLSGPFTMRQLTAAASALPQTPGPLKPKDEFFGQTAKLSQDMMAQTVASVQEQVAAGNMTAEAAQDEIAKARDALFQRNAGLLGFNPLQLAQAQLFGQDDQE